MQSKNKRPYLNSHGEIAIKTVTYELERFTIATPRILINVGRRSVEGDIEMSVDGLMVSVNDIKSIILRIDAGKPPMLSVESLDFK